MRKPARSPGKAKKDQEPGSKYPGPRITLGSDWPGARSKWPGPLAPAEISTKLRHGSLAIKGKYGESLKGLLQINPVEILPEANKDEALAAYDQLLDVVKQASRKAVGAEHLSAGIRKLGPYSIRLAQTTRGLADAIDLSAAIGRSANLSARKGLKR